MKLNYWATDQKLFYLLKLQYLPPKLGFWFFLGSSSGGTTLHEGLYKCHCHYIFQCICHCLFRWNVTFIFFLVVQRIYQQQLWYLNSSLINFQVVPITKLNYKNTLDLSILYSHCFSNSATLPPSCLTFTPVECSKFVQCLGFNGHIAHWYSAVWHIGYGTRHRIWIFLGDAGSNADVAKPFQ